MYNNRHRFQIRPGRKRSITTCLSNHPSTTVTRPPVHPSRSSGTSRSISFSVVFRLDLARFVRVPGERVDRIHEEKTALVTGLVRRFEESLLPEPLSSGVARSFVGTRSGVARRTASGVGRAARRAVGRMGRVRRGGGGKLGRNTVRRGGGVKGEMKTTAATARRRKGWPTVWHTRGVSERVRWKGARVGWQT